MAQIGRRDLLLLLIGSDFDGSTNASISGMTRLQKLLFLLEREALIKPANGGFEFEPYKAGPYSPKLYDDLELLENLGLIRSEAVAGLMTEATDPTPGSGTWTEAVDLNHVTFEELMGGFEELEGGSRAIDSFEERRFALTDKGRERVETLLRNGDLRGVTDGIRRVKSQFSRYSLRDLLRYVYKKYPEMTTEPEIVDVVLGRQAH